MLKNFKFFLFMCLVLTGLVLAQDDPVATFPDGNSPPIDFVKPRPISEELRRLQRCHAIFSSTRLPSDHYLIGQVKSRTKTGTQACMTLFDSAALQSNGKVNETSEFAKNMIFKMHQMHKNFYVTKDFFDAFDLDHTPNLIDLYEGANFLTYILMKPNQDFFKIMTNTKGYKALRNSNGPSTRMLTKPWLPINFLHGTGQNGTPYATYTPNTMIQEGLLVGFEEDNTVNPPSDIGAFWNGNYVTTNPNQHFGGGLLGLQSYILSNYGSRFNMKPNGVSLTYRRLTRNLVKDFLCRDIPVVRESDITQLVVPTSPITFRKASTCVACHATIDPLAGVYRNQITVRSVLGGAEAFTYVRTHQTDRPWDEMFPSDGNDNNFYRRPPGGKLFYRSYDGTLIDQNLTGIPDLGAKLAQSNDLPVCFAAKYYKAFTGIEVNLSDLGNPNVPALSEGEVYHRNKVINLGLALKSHKSLRKLIRSIIHSNAFVNTHHKEDP